MVSLPDGSSIYLDTETDVSVHFSKKARRIELQKGRAMFFVTHDPARPFTVSVDNIMARAVGTEFDVYKMVDGKVSIAVTKGIIRVERNKSDKATAADEVSNVPYSGDMTSRKPGVAEENARLPLSGELLASGSEMVVDRQDTSYTIQPVDSQRVSSWREGRLYFYLTPLPEVIAEVNRYMNSKILIGDPALKSQTISVNFDLKQRDLFLPTLASAISIRAQKTTSGDYILLKQ
jgi:transmembrane sensor